MFQLFSTLTFAACATLFLIAQTAPSLAQSAQAKSKTHVYLFRGFMNVFSLGMDEFSAKLEKRGIPSSVWNHLSWANAAAEAAENYKDGKTRNIIIIGHSWGGESVVSMANDLGEKNVPVALAIALDGLPGTVTSRRVRKFVNYYLPNATGGLIKKGPKFAGTVVNVDMTKLKDIGHMNIDKLPAVHNRMMREVLSAIR